MEHLASGELTSIRDRMDRDGYAIVPGVVPGDRLYELDGLRDQVTAEHERLVAAGEMFTGGGSISGHINCHPGPDSEFIHDVLGQRGLLDVVRSWDADALERPRVTMNFNMPGSHHQHYHADGLFVEKFVVINVAICDITLENGPMEVIPGTHTEFHKFWKYAVDRKYQDGVQVCLDKGDALIRYSTLWHRGTANKSSTTRPMFSVTFGEASAPDQAAYESEIVFQPNWYGTSRVSQAREHLFVAAPWLYSSLRFTRSLVGEKGNTSW